MLKINDKKIFITCFPLHYSSDYKEYNTDTAVHFIIMINRDKLVELERDGLHKAFKLQTTTTVTSMVKGK